MFTQGSFPGPLNVVLLPFWRGHKLNQKLLNSKNHQLLSPEVASDKKIPPHSCSQKDIDMTKISRCSVARFSSFMLYDSGKNI
jgi:hypothetical protein